MTLDGTEIPQLILIQPFGLAFLVIDFNGPAMASNTRDACRLPDQTVTHEKCRGVRQIRLTIVNDQTLFAIIMNVVRLTITVILFSLTLVANRDRSEDGRVSRLDRFV